MGPFEQMFGSGAAAAQQQPNAQQRFNELRIKYQSVLNSIEQQHVQLQDLHVQDNKLFIRGTAPSQEVKDKIWDQIHRTGIRSKRLFIYDSKLGCASMLKECV